MNEGCIDSEEHVTLSVSTFDTVEEPLWFGPEGRPLFGWLTTPVGALARGAVLCAPPIGREARAGRRAIRDVALSLAARGFVTLRFDFDGTGDSSGGFNDIGRDDLWIDSVVAAASFLRSLGLSSVSAVGMRLGATLIGVAADRHQLGLSSVVLWDPCESGQNFLRELHALEALRRDDFQIVSGAPIETSDYVFSTRSVEEIRRVVLSETTSTSFGGRTLVVSRDDRAMSKRLRDHLSSKDVEWQVTKEQASLLDVDPMWAVLPNDAIDAIVTWFCIPDPVFSSFEVKHAPKSAVVATAPDRLRVQERIIEFGPRRLFGIVTEPIGDAVGPLVVMFNVGNEEHTGPSRLWVELSRRWAGYGLRSVRFDLRGLGDSPWPPNKQEDEFFYEAWLDDVLLVMREMNPDDASNAVLIGLCSGAYWATEAALAVRAKGVCVINPPLYIDVLHTIRKFETSRHRVLRKFGGRLKKFTQRRLAFAKHRWLASAVWHAFRLGLPPSWSEDILKKLADDDVELLLFYGIEEVWPYERIPFFRSMDFRRLEPSRLRRVEFVPELDHGMHAARGRARTINMLDRHVLEHLRGIEWNVDSPSFFTEET